jgi:YgiT-type zinc finger domain-containing protein
MTLRPAATVRSLHAVETAPEAGAPACSRCGGCHLALRKITTAFWRDGQLFMVQGIPAIVCDRCGEEHIAAATAEGLEALRDRLDLATPAARMEVPVYDFAPRRRG